MSVKLIVVACLVAVSTASWNGPQAGGLPAAQFPAGINPDACPNYPNCENPAVALTSNIPIPGTPGAPPQQYNADSQWNSAPSASQWNSAPAAPQWNSAPAQQQQQYNAAPAQQQWNSAPVQQQKWNSAPVHEQQWNAPSSSTQWNAPTSAPQWNSPSQGYNSAPASAAQVPAGVDPSSCPNYPFCS